MRALPGVQSAAAIDTLPSQGGSVQPVVVEGTAELSPRDQPTVAVRQVSPEYLRTMQVPLRRGRDVSDADQEGLLVSASAARLLWGEKDPIGTRVTLPLMSRTVMREVVGIVADVKLGDLTEAPVPTVYLYSHQKPSPGMAIVLRTSVPPLTVARAASGAVQALDPGQPVEDILTMDAVLEQTLTSQRFSVLLLGGFATVALSLASVGIYSVLSYIVRGRSREIGIRTALGARTADVVRLVVFEGMAPALVGIGDGHRRRDHGGPGAEEAGVRGERLRSDHAVRRRRHPGIRRAGREPRARLPCVAARSTRRSAGRLREAVRRVGDRSAAEGHLRPAAPGDAAGSIVRRCRTA